MTMALEWYDFLSVLSLVTISYTSCVLHQKTYFPFNSENKYTYLHRVKTPDLKYIF